jgi:hypothetical protein
MAPNKTTQLLLRARADGTKNRRQGDASDQVLVTWGMSQPVLLHFRADIFCGYLIVHLFGTQAVGELGIEGNPSDGPP